MSVILPNTLELSPVMASFECFILCLFLNSVSNLDISAILMFCVNLSNFISINSCYFLSYVSPETPKTPEMKTKNHQHIASFSEKQVCLESLKVSFNLFITSLNFFYM
jgi:hypothetical protein